jgi:thioredoxin-related protein
MIQFGFHKTENAWHFFSKQKETSVPGYVDKVTFFLLLFKFKTNKKKREWNKKGDFHSFCFQKESPIEEVFKLF